MSFSPKIYYYQVNRQRERATNTLIKITPYKLRLCKFYFFNLCVLVLFFDGVDSAGMLKFS